MAADFLADTGHLPGPPLLPPDVTWFGLVMNSERIIHRIARRRHAEYTVMATSQVPHELFRAAAHSPDQAATEFDRFNISVDRWVSEQSRGGDA